MNNYKVLFSLSILKHILSNFVDSFLVLYFIQISDNNILPFGLYKLVSFFAIYLVIFLLRNLSKSKHRINLLRIGIILDFLYFLAIIILREKIVNYACLIGLLFGIEEGFYYSIYNIFESDGVNNKERSKFMGISTATRHIMLIIFPLIFGSLIYETGFIKTLTIVLIMVIIRIILSFIFKDKNIPKSSKANLKEYEKIAKQNIKIKQVYNMRLFSGLTFSGAFSYIIIIYIIKVFSNSISLGIFTSIFSFVSCILGLLFAKVIKQKHYNIIIKLSTFFTILSLFILIYKCNMITIILFKFFQTLLTSLIELINDTTEANVSNIDILKKEYKVEYRLGVETSYFIGRVISNILFIMMAFINPNIIMCIFAIFLIFLAINSIKLQNTIENT